MKPTHHPLGAWLRTVDDQQRDRAATLAGTSTNYLYQIASLRREPKVTKAFAIEAAVAVVTPSEPVTARQIALAWANKEKHE